MSQPAAAPGRAPAVPSAAPVTPVAPRPWWRRLLSNPWTWVVVAMALVGVASLWHTYAIIHRDVEVEQGGRSATIPGVTMDSVRLAARYAWPTAAVWSLLFIWLDRYRPRHFAVWFTCFAWGAAVATWVSMHVNSWMAGMLSVRGGVDPTAGAGPAIFSAPLVEESTKATILFVLAIVLGTRIASVPQMVSLAGLSAIGFAFVENILYYARADNYARVTIQAGDPEEALSRLVLLRGVLTSFGHPLFTSMTGIGLAVGLRSRSRLVRVLAPLTGFLAAVAGHMSFNGLSSTMSMDQLRRIYPFALLALLGLVITVLVRLWREGRVIEARLRDYVVMGWLDERDPVVLSGLRRRWWTGLVALTHGWRCWRATMAFQRHLTDLAYLRDAVVRGLAGDTTAREVELLDAANAARPLAVTESKGARLQRPRLPSWWPRPSGRALRSRWPGRARRVGPGSTGGVGPRRSVQSS